MSVILRSDSAAAVAFSTAGASTSVMIKAEHLIFHMNFDAAEYFNLQTQVWPRSHRPISVVWLVISLHKKWNYLISLNFQITLLNLTS